MSVWDTVTDTVSQAWDSASGAVSSLWGPSKPEAPITVPVSPEAEENARQMVARSDAWDAAGHTGSMGDERQAQNVKNWAARDAGFPDAQAQADYRAGKAAYDQALDAYLAGKGPSPGPQNEFIQKQNQERPTYIPDRLR
jgi:hypothetical protein